MQARVRYLNSVLNHVWHRWSRTYWIQESLNVKHLRPIMVGDVVLLEDQDKPQGFWKLARVKKLLAGKDEKARGAEIRS